MRYRFAVILSATVLLFGCSGGKTINAGTGQIDLKIWVVHGPGDTMGGSGNKGSRLSQSDINDFIEHLRTNASLYGLNPTFITTSSTASVATDNSLLPFGSRNRNFGQFYSQVILTNGHWTNNKLNIYFAGWVEDDGSETTNALTLDPELANESDLNPLIIVNDGGFSMSTGFLDSPAFVQGKNVFEHEMEHYLARFEDRTFSVPLPARTYDGQEHVQDGLDNLLDEFGPHPLHIPGRYDQAGTEKNEIWDRINAGNWNNP